MEFARLQLPPMGYGVGESGSRLVAFFGMITSQASVGGIFTQAMGPAPVQIDVVRDTSDDLFGGGYCCNIGTMEASS
jgi:hypothetical protein